MNRFNLLACVSLAAITMTSQLATAGDFQPYVSVFAGASFPNNLQLDYAGTGRNFDLGLNSGYLVGGAIGAHITDELRAEIELSRAFFQSNGKGHNTSDGGRNFVAAGDVHATYLMANAWYDIQTETAFTPYVGGGAGVGWVGGNVIFGPGPFGFGGSTSAGFAFQLGGGVKFDLSENVALDLGYRFKDIIGASANNTNAIIPGWDAVDLSSHTVQLGLTLKF